MERTTEAALRALNDAQESDATVEDALKTVREANADAEWDFEAMPDVDISDDEGTDEWTVLDA